MQQVDDPPSLLVGTEVSAKYKGAFCEAKVRKVVRNIKVKVAYKQGLGSGIVSDDAIKSGILRVGATVEVKHPDKREFVEATITKIQDCSQYTVVFDDGDITTLRRTALCLKSGRHFNESETLDQLPLTHPEHFGNPVIGGRRGRRSRQFHEESSEDEDENDSKEVVNEKEENVGKIVFVESTDTKKKDKEKWFPGLIVSPTAQVTVRIRVKDEYLVRSFKDGRYYTVPKKEATEFTREFAAKQDGPAVQAALEYLDNDVLPPHWDRDALFGIGNSSTDYEGEVDSDSSDDEPREEKDHFVAQLYKYMDDRGTPLNKVPSITNRDVDLYRLFRAVHKLGGYNRVTSQNQWKAITMRLGFTPATVSVTNLVKQAYKKFLQPFEEFNRKLGCSMSMTPRSANRTKGRSLVRANSVASPKLEIKEKVVPVVEESENTSESSMDLIKSKRKYSFANNKVKSLVEKFEEKNKEADIEPQPPIKAGKQSTKDDGNLSIPIISNKKERGAPRKNPPTEERRGRKKKEVIEPEKQQEKPVEPVVTVADFPVEVGDKLKVYYHEKKVTYEAKVIDLSIQHGTPLYLVHYTGWNTRYDEWVPKERIAENISNNKTKRTKGGPGNQKNNPNLIKEERKSTSSDRPLITKSGSTSKRGRGRSDSQPPRSTTPLSLISNLSRTKSPAASVKRRTPRLQASASRRASNNVSDVSIQSDSDTDSDEPVKKPTKSTTSSNASGSTSSTQATAGSVKAADDTKSASSTAVNSPSETEEDDIPISVNGAKGRDYDLNQIRSELKGLNELKSPSPDPETTTTQLATEKSHTASVFSFDSANENSNSKPVATCATKPSLAVGELKSSSTDLSSETDSFADDDSQSSDKTTTLENMTEKLQLKIKAEKLAQAKGLSGKASEKISPIKSAGLEKIIEKSLAEKMQETLKAKPFLIEKNIFKSSIEKDEKHKSGVETKTQTNKQITSKLSSFSSLLTTEKNSISTPIFETKSLRMETRKLSAAIDKSSSQPVTIKATTQKESGHTADLSSTTLTSSLIEKNLKDISKSSPPTTTTTPATDVYEFKEPEPFEFESRKPTILSHSSSELIEKKKKSVQKSESNQDSKSNISTSSSVSGITNKKNKKSPLKDPQTEVKSAKQLKFEEKSKTLTTETATSTVNSGNTSTSVTPSPSSSGLLTVPTIATSKLNENPFDVLRKSPSFNLNINALNEELATTVQETAKALSDMPPIDRIIPITLPSPQKLAPSFTSPFVESTSKPQIDTKNVFEIKSDDESTKSDQNEDQKPIKKPELETVKKILLSDSAFDLEPPKIEKPSIADKVLKALNQQKQEEKIKEPLSPPLPPITTPLSIQLPQSLSSSSPLTILSNQLPLQSPSSSSLLPLIEPTNSSSSSSSVDQQLPPIDLPRISSPFTVTTEPPKIELPAAIKKEIEISIKKPILNSPEHKLDILESIASKNNDLSETIQKLESVIQKTTNVNNFGEDSTDSTDSERRLVIEDDSQSSDNQLVESSKMSLTTTSSSLSVITSTATLASLPLTTTTITTAATTTTTTTAAAVGTAALVSPLLSSAIGTESEDNIISTNKMTPVISSIGTVTGTTTASMTTSSNQSHVNIMEEKKLLIPTTMLKSETTIKSEDIQKNLNFTPKFQSNIFGLQSIVFSDPSVLSDAGVKPIVDLMSPIKNEIANENEQKPKLELINATVSESSTDSIATTTVSTTTASPIVLQITTVPKEEPLTTLSAMENINIHSESINLLLCEETIPGSPTPIRDTINIEIKPNIHPIEADIKPIPMDIECGPLPCSTDPSSQTSASSIKMMKNSCPSSMIGGNSGVNTTIGIDNQTPGSSPRDSISQDDSSEDLKKQIEEKDNDAVKKRRRARKHSEAESTYTKRRRTTVVSTITTRGTASDSKRNGSDSEDNNSDANVTHQRIRASRPCQFNFLVQLDPAMNPNQRISILKKKIQELRKTYNMIKAELASIERRRKKLRRREREKKNQQKLNS